MFEFLKQKLTFLWVTLMAAICAGALLNQFRNQPVPLIYQDKEARLKKAVDRLTPVPVELETALPGKKLPEFLPLEEFSEFAGEGEGLILDARPEIFHRLGHVPGAISLPRDDFEHAYKAFREKLEEDKGQPIVVYCSNASCEDSELLKTSLKALGFTNVSVFKGGWGEWTSAGKPEESGN